MGYREVISLESEEPIDQSLLHDLLLQFGETIKCHGIEIFIFDLDSYCIDQCQRQILENGISKFLSQRNIGEAILPPAKASDEKDILIDFMIKCLQRLAPWQKLIIIDRYFFPRKNCDRNEYIRVLTCILDLFIPKMESITFITKDVYDHEMLDIVRRKLLGVNPQIEVKHRTCDEFHDRFWIMDEEKGIVLGTSLNGLGNKYTLLDYMKEDDVVYIVSELRKLALI